MILILSAHANSVRAQSWIPNYVPTDPSGHPNVAPYNSGSFVGTPSGSAANSYPKTISPTTPYLYSLGAPWSNDVLNCGFFGMNPVTGTANPAHPLPSLGVTAFAADQGETPTGFTFDYSDGGISANASGDYTITLTWDPIWQSYSRNRRAQTDLLSMSPAFLSTLPPPPAPPSQVYIRVTTNGGASSSMGQYDTSLLYYLGAYNGGGTATVTDSIGDSLTGSSSDSQRSSGQGINGYTELVKASGGGNTATLTIHATVTALSAPSVAPSNYRLCTTSSASISYMGQYDPRLTSISSPTIEPSYSCGAPISGNPENGYAAILDVNDPNANVKSVDSVVGWDTMRAQWTSTASFLANATGFTNPTYVWNESGDGSDVLPGYLYNSTTNSYCNVLMTLGNTATGFPKHNTFTVSSTDGIDSCQESASYNVTWHLPVEFMKDPVYGEKTDNLVIWPNDSPVPLAKEGTGVDLHFTEGNNYLADVDSWGAWVVASQLGASDNPIIACLFTAIGILTTPGGSPYQETSDVPENLQFNTYWGPAVAAYQSGVPNKDAYFASGNNPSQSDIDDGGYFYSMEGFYIAGYNVEHWIGAEYGPKGFNGLITIDPRKYPNGGGMGGGVFSRTQTNAGGSH